MAAEPDEAEFRQFVLGCHHRLLRTAYVLTGDHARAEDLVQIALVRLYRHWNTVESPEAYARKVLVNLHNNWWRRWKRSGEVLTELPPEPDWAGPQTTGELEAALWSALLTLPPRMRAVVVLRYFDGMTVTDVAATLGCTEGTVKSQTFRGLVKLREALDPERSGSGPAPAAVRRST